MTDSGLRRACALLLVVASSAVTIPLFAGAPSTAAPIRVGRVHESFQPTNGKVFVLVIGSDARYGNPMSGVNGDALHLVGLNTRTMRGGILNFPRDAFVRIPDYGAAKINQALKVGGPLRVVQTIENLTKIRIDYWVMVGFQGFQAIVKKLGGVRMNVPTPVYDSGGSGASLHAGMQRLAGYEALAYMRARKPFFGGDVARTTNQARFLLALLAKLRWEVDRNPALLLNWITAGQRFARFDMTAGDVFRLAVLASRVKPRDVGTVTIPVSLGWVGPQSVVFIGNGAQSIYARFRKHASL